MPGGVNQTISAAVRINRFLRSLAADGRCGGGAGMQNSAAAVTGSLAWAESDIADDL
jgi:hypothetical protein